MDGIQFQWLGLTLIPLVGFLVFKHRQRQKKRAAQRAARLQAIKRDGHPSNFKPLQERIAAVRADYDKSCYSRPADASTKRSLLSRARAKLIHLGFFQHHPSPAESELRTH